MELCNYLSSLVWRQLTSAASEIGFISKGAVQVPFARQKHLNLHSWRNKSMSMHLNWSSDKARTNKICRHASSEQRPWTRLCHETERLVEALFRSNVPFGKSFSRSSSRAAGDFSQRRPEKSWARNRRIFYLTCGAQWMFLFIAVSNLKWFTFVLSPKAPIFCNSPLQILFSCCLEKVDDTQKQLK